MDLKEIQELIKLLNKSNISELRLEQDNFKLTLRTHDQNAPVQIVRPEVTNASPVMNVPIQPVAPPTVQALPGTNEAAKPEAPREDSKLITIKSPMIGTFYRSSTPDKPYFV